MPGLLDLAAEAAAPCRALHPAQRRHWRLPPPGPGPGSCGWASIPSRPWAPWRPPAGSLEGPVRSPFDPKPFRPHLTLARFREPVDLERLAFAPGDPVTFGVDRFELWQSESHPPGQPVPFPGRTAAGSLSRTPGGPPRFPEGVVPVHGRERFPFQGIAEVEFAQAGPAAPGQEDAQGAHQVVEDLVSQVPRGLQRRIWRTWASSWRSRRQVNASRRTRTRPGRASPWMPGGRKGKPQHQGRHHPDPEPQDQIDLQDGQDLGTEPRGQGNSRRESFNRPFGTAHPAYTFLWRWSAMYNDVHPPHGGSVRVLDGDGLPGPVRLSGFQYWI